MRALLNAVKTGFTEIWAHKMRSVQLLAIWPVGGLYRAFSAIFATYERLGAEELPDGQDEDLPELQPDLLLPTTTSRRPFSGTKTC